MRKLIPLLLLLLLLAACATPPAPALERPTPATPVPSATRPRATGTAPAPAVTATATKPAPTATATVKPPTVTATVPVPTSTPTSGVTPTPVAGGCDETQWHAPVDAPGCHHHHGVNPRDYADVFSIDGFDLNAWLDEYGELLQPWMTFNEDPVGAIWFYVNAGPTGCVLDFEGIDPNLGDEFACVTDALYRIHDVGTLAHLVNRFHSESFIIRACNRLPGDVAGTECGIAAGGVRADYGTLHVPYKQYLCHIPTEPGWPNYPDDKIDQPSYRTGQYVEPRDGFIQNYWVQSDINPIVQGFYPVGTNWLFNSAWLSMDGWQLFPRDLVCNLSPTVDIDLIKTFLASVEPYPLEGNRHITFKVNDITLRAHPPGPFDGAFDPFGGACDEEDSVCLPLFITANFPDGPVSYHQGAEPGECPGEENPCIVFDTGGVEMVFPPEDVP